MVEDIWKEREEALENAFFMKRNEELLQKLKHQLQQETRKEALREACGITDERVLDSLLAVELDAEALTAIVMVPLVIVAWSDDSIAVEERNAILQAADAEGIETGTVCHQLLERWLEDPPTDELLTAWKNFVQVVVKDFSAEALTAFREEVMGRVKKVATAAGGILGVGSHSASERAAIEDLEATFSS